MHRHTQPHATAAPPAAVLQEAVAHDDAVNRAHTHADAHTHRSVAEHRDAVRALLEPLRNAGHTERLALSDALGRGLAEDITAPLDLPPFANSQMDGFAIRAADVPESGAELRVAAPVPAGARPAPLQPGTAAPIMTGAMVPPGADAVIPIERAVPAASGSRRRRDSAAASSGRRDVHPGGRQRYPCG